MFIVCSYLSGSIGIVRKNVTKDAVMVCICIITHTIFFIIIAPVSHYRGTPRFWAFFGLFFLWVEREGRPCSRPSGSPSCALVVGVISLCGAWVGNLCWMYKLYPLLGIFVVLRGVFSAEGVF